MTDSAGQFPQEALRKPSGPPPATIARLFAVAVAVMLFVLSAGTAAHADAAMQGMTMKPGQTISGMTRAPAPARRPSNAMPGMTMKPGQTMSDITRAPAPAKRHSNAMPGMSTAADARYGPKSTATRWIVIGAFVAIMFIALVSAALVRRRPAARKRRGALARVRASHLNVTPPGREQP